jgi:hypothetical protein
MGYKDDVAKGKGLAGLSDFHVLKAGVAHQAQLLSTDGPTVMRIYPDFSDGMEKSFRIGDAENEFSDWMHFEWMLRYFGVNGKATVLLRTKGRDSNFKGPIQTFQNNLYSLTKHAGRGSYPEEWARWFKKDEDNPKNKGAAIPAPDGMGLVQGMLFEHGGKRMLSPDGRTYKPVHPVVVMLTKSARKSIEDLCNIANPNAKGPAFEDRYAAGSIVHTATGRLVSVVFNPPSGTSTAHYAATLLDQVVPIPPELVKSEWRPWDELLDVLDEAQQVELLCRLFPEDAVDYVFGPHAEFARYLPETVRGAYARRTGRATVATHQSVPGLVVAPTTFAPATAPGLAAASTGFGPLPATPTAPCAQPAYSAPLAPYTPAATPAVTVGPMQVDFTSPVPAGPSMPNLAPNMATPDELQRSYIPPAAAGPSQPTGDAATDAARMADSRARLHAAVAAATGRLPV